VTNYFSFDIQRDIILGWSFSTNFYNQPIELTPVIDESKIRLKQFQASEYSYLEKLLFYEEIPLSLIINLETASERQFEKYSKMFEIEEAQKRIAELSIIFDGNLCNFLKFFDELLALTK